MIPIQQPPAIHRLQQTPPRSQFMGAIPELSPVAARVQRSFEGSLPFVESSEGDVYLLPVNDSLPLPQLQMGLAELVNHGRVRQFRLVNQPGQGSVAVVAVAPVRGLFRV
jgi:hypothetical protein